VRRWRARLLRVRAAVRAKAAGSTARVRAGRGVRLARHVRLVVGRESASALRLGPRCSIGDAASVVLRGGEIELAADVVAGDDVYLEASRAGSIRVRARAELRPGAVLRADEDEISIGAGAVIGDLAVLSASAGGPVRVGDGAEVGVKATLLPGADVAAGARVPPHTVVDGPFSDSPPVRAAARTATRPARPAPRRSGPAARSR
jgi:carbonic anhydrase/acetyltransferase-like protein (isoleucine patch superfamily)